MARDPLLSYTASVEPAKLSSPSIFLFRMLVFLTLCSLLLVVLYKQILERVPLQSGTERRHRRGAGDRHHPRRFGR